MNELVEETARVERKKLGRKPKGFKKTYVLDTEQTKFVVKLKDQENDLQLVFNLLSKINQKNFGREVSFKDLALYALTKLGDNDLEAIKECSLSPMEKVQRELDIYNNNNMTSLNMGEFLTMKLGIE